MTCEYFACEKGSPVLVELRREDSASHGVKGEYQCGIGSKVNTNEVLESKVNTNEVVGSKVNTNDNHLMDGTHFHRRWRQRGLSCSSGSLQ